MSIEISRETEARLTDEARRLGIFVDALLARLVAGHVSPVPARPRPDCRRGISARGRFTGAISMTTSVEPGIVDTNVLIYALDTVAPQHTAALALLDAAREDAATLFVTSQILCEFYSVVTNPRRVARPRDAAEALTVLSEMLSFLHVLPIPARLDLDRVGAIDSAS